MYKNKFFKLFDICLIGGLIFCFDSAILSCGRAWEASPMGPFPEEVEDTFFNVKDFGASGNGSDDDTLKIQNAITAAINKSIAEMDLSWKTGAPVQVVYFPNGIYKVSNTLKVDRKDNSNAPVNIILLGESRDGTVIKLEDNIFTGKGDNPVITFVQRPEGGNNFFWNSVMHMTVDTGIGNTGAVGIEYHNNNYGRIEEVTIRSSDPSDRGRKGLKIEKSLSGLGLIKNLRVEGFSYGISIKDEIINYTFENIELIDQRKAGIRINRKPAQIRSLYSSQSRKWVPAVLQEHADGNLIILDSELRGAGSSSKSAIMNNAGQLFVRNVTTSGYVSAINDHGETISGNDVDEYIHDQCYALHDPAHNKSLNLQIKETPSVLWDSFSGEKEPTWWGYTQGDWAVVISPGVDRDATSRIQAAIDSGKTTVFLKHGTYRISDSIIIRGNVRRFHGGWSNIYPDSSIWDHNIPMFQIATGNHNITVIQSFERRNGSSQGTDNIRAIDNNSSKTVVLKDIAIWKAKIYQAQSSSTGPVYMEMVSGGLAAPTSSLGSAFTINNSEVYARGLNPEGFRSHIEYSRAKGKMVLLGFKVGEFAGPYFNFSNGSIVEVLGGLMNSQDARYTNQSYEFLVSDSIVSIIGVAERREPGTIAHRDVIIESLNGIKLNMPHPEYGGSMPTRHVYTPEAINIPMYLSGMSLNTSQTATDTNTNDCKSSLVFSD
ncbi:MAG: glycoside hydrolase family 55 protein [Xenococcus sp. (in: cyanobacteria)]